VTAAEGYNDPGDAQELTYQWYYSAPGELGWTAVSNGVLYADATTDTLQILNALTLDGYQYYCEVREDDATCYTASNAVKLDVNASVWDGASWSPTVPDINTVAIIEGDYNTNVGGEQSSFSACNLLVISGTLTISDNTYVEVENNVTVDSEIIVNEHGSFLQNNNNGTVTVSGTVLVRKETAPMNNWYEYTYWGSPVAGETIGTALGDAHPNRRFNYAAQNYLDATEETNNDNGTIPGQDDIDDDANDWVAPGDSHVLIPGVGYASTHNPAAFNVPGPLPRQYVYSFIGPFNNGIYNVPTYRNDSELNDNNWNLLGNPYPSAIDADLFLSENTVLNNTIDGAIYFWSQNTAPSNTANGNEVLNFSDDDYAIINSTAQTAGGDNLIPTRFIPSGQGFFVTMSDGATANPIGGQIFEGSVVFNNSMRVTGNNEQFFRSSAPQFNKLWLNLTSDNGVFNQIAIGYVDGATDAYDGMYYDAPRNQSNNTFSSIYTLIPATNKRFAIQGKSPNSLTLDEVIPLGFHTSITVATLYQLSIPQWEGEFFATQTVYLRDHLLNLTHNLSTSAYSFTSETGEFNSRFEIVFKDQALSVIENEITVNELSIIELSNGQVKFSVGSGLNIYSVEIIDMLGRTLYRLKGHSNTEIYELSNLSQAAYIAKVTLSNGQVITKRAVKRE